MKLARTALVPLLLFATSPLINAENTVIAEDDASDGTYGSSWDNSKNGGSGFSNWTLVTDKNEHDSYAGFFIAEVKNNPDCKGIARNDKAFGVYANGFGFEQAIAYRNFEKPLQPGDSFSFMMQNKTFEKKSDQDVPTPGSIGIVLRSGPADSTVGDYQKGALFEFGFYQGNPNYQIQDGSGDDKADTGIPINNSGVSVTVTVTGPDTYDLEIQTLSDKDVTKRPGRKFSSTGEIKSFAVFDRNGEKYDAFFNQFQVTRESK